MRIHLIAGLFRPGRGRAAGRQERSARPRPSGWRQSRCGLCAQCHQATRHKRLIDHFAHLNLAPCHLPREPPGAPLAARRGASSWLGIRHALLGYAEVVRWFHISRLPRISASAKHTPRLGNILSNALQLDLQSFWLWQRRAPSRVLSSLHMLKSLSAALCLAPQPACRRIRRRSPPAIRTWSRDSFLQTSASLPYLRPRENLNLAS